MSSRMSRSSASSKPARDDLREIRSYIAGDSERYARLVVRELVGAVGRLRAYPLSGRIVPELGRPTLREVIEGTYRIVYRVTPDQVEVLTVVHAARDKRVVSSPLIPSSVFP